jgi:ferredoxin-NADP reductase
MHGDKFELRGPIGGYFVWEPDGATEPLFLVAGGSGIVPLMAMLRLRHAAGSTVPAKLLYSSRTIDDVIYRDELPHIGADVVQTLTRAQPPGWDGYARRVDIELLRDVAYPPERNPRVFVCGPTNFVEAVAEGLVALGHRPGRIRTERFGGA